MRPNGALLVGIALAIGWGVLQQREAFEALEVKTHDWRFRQRSLDLQGVPLNDPGVTLVEITERCIQDVGRWPWSRAVLARLVDGIASGSPRVLGIDIQFYEPSDPGDDRALARAVARAGNVVLANDLATDWKLDPVTGDFDLDLGINEPLPALGEAARATGLVNIDPYVENPDGILRKTPLAKKVGGRFVASFATRLASLYLGVQPAFDDGGVMTLGAYRVPTVPGKLAALTAREALVPAPLGFEQCAWINYEPIGPRGAYFRKLEASKILAGSVDRDALKDRIVLVGVSALGADKDNKLTVHGLMSGVEFQANVVRNLRERNFLVRIGPRIQTGILLVLGLIGAFAFARMPLSTSLAGGVLAIGLLVEVARRLYLDRGIILDIVPAGTLLAVQLVVEKLIILARELSRRIRNLERLNASSRSFHAVLDLELVTDRVLASLIENSGGSGALLAVVRQDTGDLAVYTRGTVPDRLVALLHHKRIYRELEQLWGSESVSGPLPGPVLANRPAVAPDQAELFRDMVFFPAYLKDQVEGFIVLQGAGFEGRRWSDEASFWLTLASMARAAYENGVLYKLATVDALTTLFVRHFFDIEIEKTFGRAARYQENMALLMIDIDHFKRLNDTYGHQTGDRALRAVAQEVKRTIRVSDVACRYGGEEFAVILPATEQEGAGQLAERIRSRIEALCVPSGEHEISVTLSIGVTFMPGSRAKTAHEFIEEADAALYQAKRAGRNRVVAHKTDAVGIEAWV